MVSAEKCLAAVQEMSASTATRQLASLLFEYMAPGRRHPEFMKNNAIKGSKRPFFKKDKYKSGVVFVQKFEKAYHDTNFREYVRHGGYILKDYSLEERMQLLETITADSKDGDGSSFLDIASEYRRCLAVVDWFYIGNAASWFGNTRHCNTAIQWLHASDEVRRRSLLEAPQYLHTCDLTSAYVKSLGQDYQMRIQKRVKHLGWLCEQPFRHKDRYFEKTKLNFNLSRRDAKYMVLLYGLKVRLESKALERFEEAGSVVDPEFGGAKKRKRMRIKAEREKREKERLQRQQAAAQKEKQIMQDAIMGGAGAAQQEAQKESRQ